METITLKMLVDGLKSCFRLRCSREPIMDALLDEFYFAALIKTVRKVHTLCRKIDVSSSRAELQIIAGVVANELAPTAGQANCYDRESIANVFGDKMNKKMEALLNECLNIDCNVAGGAKIPVVQNTIEPICKRVELLWEEIVEIYCQKVCLLGCIGKLKKKKMVELRIERSVPRVISFSLNEI